MFNRKDYTARDYASIMSQIKTYIAVEYPNLKLDFSAMSPEQLFLDISAFIGDGHHLYIDSAFSEFFVDSMAEQENGISLGKWVGYEAPMFTAPTIEVPYTYATTGLTSATVIRGTTIKDQIGNSWTTIEDQVVTLAGGTLIFYQGQFVSDSWGGTGAPNQEVITSRQGVATNVTPTILIDSVSATRVLYLLNQNLGKFYEQTNRTDTTMKFRFGDGINGCLVNSNISAEYFTSKGAEGRIKIGQLRGKLTPNAGVTVTYQSNTSSTGGGDVASIETIRRAIPAWVSSLNTLVTKEDFKSLIEAYPGIQLTSVTFNPLLRRNVYFVMSSNYGTVPEYTLNYLNNLFRSKYQINSSGIFQNIEFAQIILSLRVYLEAGLDVQKSSKQTIINQTILKYFQPGDGDTVYCQTGQPLRLSDIYGMLESIAGVSYVEVDIFTRKPTLSPVNWTVGLAPIVLDSWALRPTFRLNQQNSYGISSEFLGDLNPSELGKRAVKLVYNNRVSSPSGSAPIGGTAPVDGLTPVGGLGNHSDWTSTLGMVPLEKVSIITSNAFGNYTWVTWENADDTLRDAMALAIKTDFSNANTAHFKISHYIDSTEHLDTGLGYLGTSYQIDSGSFTFMLDSTGGSSTDVTVSSETVNLNSDNFTYLINRNLRVGSISGTASIGGVTDNFYDDSQGGLISTLNKRVIGIVDYDKGIVIFNSTHVVTAIDYSYIVFDNKTGDESEITLSPYSHSIALREDEYPQLYSLILEVGVE